MTSEPHAYEYWHTGSDLACIYVPGRWMRARPLDENDPNTLECYLYRSGVSVTVINPAGSSDVPRSFTSNEATAQRVLAAVDRIGHEFPSANISLIGYSNGANVCHIVLRQCTATARVGTFVNIDGQIDLARYRCEHQTGWRRCSDRNETRHIVEQLLIDDRGRTKARLLFESPAQLDFVLAQSAEWFDIEPTETCIACTPPLVSVPTYAEFGSNRALPERERLGSYVHAATRAEITLDTMSHLALIYSAAAIDDVFRPISQLLSMPKSTL